MLRDSLTVYLRTGYSFLLLSHPINFGSDIETLSLPKLFIVSDGCPVDIELAVIQKLGRHNSSGSFVHSSQLMTPIAGPDRLATHVTGSAAPGPSTVQMTIHVVALSAADVDSNVTVSCITNHCFGDGHIDTLWTTRNE